jgi:hypothetical protein
MKNYPTFFHFDTSARVCTAISNAREVTFPTSARLYGRKALVQRHARLARYNLARCVLTPLHGKKRDLRVNFPLSTNSAFGEKNVSLKNENIFGWSGAMFLSAP